MNRIFTLRKGIQVPDGTIVYPFLNGFDRKSGLPPDILQEFSLATGEIGPQSASKIHVMPLVTQATFVLRGLLEVRMKDPQSPAPYTLRAVPYEAVLTRPGTFLQLINPSRFPVQVLYIVSPPYILEIGADGKSLYDDAVVLEEGWEQLERMQWNPPGLRDGNRAPESRRKAANRITGRRETSAGRPSVSGGQDLGHLPGVNHDIPQDKSPH